MFSSILVLVESTSIVRRRTIFVGHIPFLGLRVGGLRECDTVRGKDPTVQGPKSTLRGTLIYFL